MFSRDETAIFQNKFIPTKTMVKGKIVIIICEYGFAPRGYVLKLANYIYRENTYIIIDSKQFKLLWASSETCV